MDMKVNIEIVLAFYKQRVAELEHELILQRAVNESLKGEIEDMQSKEIKKGE